MIVPHDFARKQFELTAEFGKLVLDHPEVDDALPDGTYVYFEIAGEAEFNQYSRDLAERQQREDGVPIVCVSLQEDRYNERYARSEMDLPDRATLQAASVPEVREPMAEKPEKPVEKKPRKIKVGDESVVMGDVNADVGHRSVVIGATDDRGNVILNQPMAVGHRAQAGPGSIAIGSYASAGGVNQAHLLAQLSEVLKAMRQAADAADHAESVNHVAEATEAAKKNDGSAVVRHLKAAGGWAFDFATRVGASLVASLIAHSLQH